MCHAGASSGAGSQGSIGSSTWALSEDYVIIVLFIWQTATTLALIVMCIMIACRRRKRTHPKYQYQETFQNGGHAIDKQKSYHEGGVPIKRKKKSIPNTESTA